MESASSGEEPNAAAALVVDERKRFGNDVVAGEGLCVEHVVVLDAALNSGCRRRHWRWNIRRPYRWNGHDALRGEGLRAGDEANAAKCA